MQAYCLSGYNKKKDRLFVILCPAGLPKYIMKYLKGDFMDVKQIKELADILVEAKLTSIEVCEGEAKIKLEKSAAVAAPAAVQYAQPAAAAAGEGRTARQASAVEDGELGVNFIDLTDVTSPIVGIFYSAPSPDMLPYVSIGSKVKKGDVLCIVEAMKQMNEITAETDGEIVDICIKNGDIAEFGQVLFKMR